MDEFGARHARWYADWLAGRADERLAGRLIGSWEPEDEEHDNIRAALAWARDDGDVVLELRLAASAGLFYWPSRGHLTEGLRWLRGRAGPIRGRRRGTAGPGIARPDADRLAAGRLRRLRGGRRPRRRRCSSGSTTALRWRWRSWHVRSQPRDGATSTPRWRTPTARSALFRELGNTSALDAVLNNRGYAEIIAGNFESAERRLRELAESATGRSRLFATANHALALARLGRLDEAEERFASVLQSAVDERSTEIMFYGFEGLAVVAGSRAEDMRAAQLWGVAAGITEATGYVLGMAEQVFHDELVPEVRGRLGEAAFDQAWSLGRQRSFDEAIALALRRP